MRALAIAAIVLGCAATTVPAQPASTIEEQRNRAHAEEIVATDIRSANWICKTSLPEANVIEWPTWKIAVDAKGNRAASQCGHAIEGVERLCRTDAIARDTFTKRVTRIVCRGDGQGDLKLELKGSTLVVHTFLGVKDTDHKAHKWLYDNLKP